MRQLAPRSCLLLLIFLLAIGCPAWVHADGPVEPVSPSGTIAAGQSLIFRIRTKDLVPPLRAVLNYRSIGSLSFLTMPLKQESEIEFASTLEGAQLLPPGLEYYFVVADGLGRLYTFPQQNPIQQPLRIDLSLEQTAAVELQLPAMDGARLEARRANLVIRLTEIGVPVDFAALRLTVDDVDVTQIAVLDGALIRYSPEADLAYGSHRVSLEAMDASGNLLAPQHWSFTIPKSGMFDSASAQAQFDVQMSGLLLEQKDGVEPDWNIQSNLALASVIQSGDLRVSMNANGWYTQQQDAEPTGDVFNLNNYLLSLEYGQQKLAVGDLQASGTELTGGDISRRGGLLDLSHGGSHLQGFLLNSNAVTGFSNLSGMDAPDQRLYGGSLEQIVLDQDALVLKGTIIAGKNEIPDDYNSGSLIAGNEGGIYSLRATSRLFEEHLDLGGEYSRSDYDVDISDDQGRSRDEGWLLSVASRADDLAYGGGYKYLGQNFHSIVTPSTAANRAEYNLYGTKTYNQASLTANLLHSRDNVDRDPLQPLVRNSNFDLTYNLFKTDWPVFFINSMLGLQDSTDEPDGLTALKNRTETIGGGFTLVKEKWNLVPSYHFTRFVDDSPTDSDSQTHQFVLALGFQPRQTISLSPSLSYSRISDEKTSVVNETWQGVVAGVFNVSPTQNLNLTLSAIDSRADDGSLHTTSYDTISQYNWLLQAHFWEKLQKTISLRGRYNWINEQVGRPAAENYSVFLMLSFGGAPLQLL